MEKNTRYFFTLFYHSPLGALEVHLKNNQIYSVSKVKDIYAKKKNIHTVTKGSVSVLRAGKEIICMKKKNIHSMAEWVESRSHPVDPLEGLPVGLSLERKKQMEQLLQQLLSFLDHYFLESEKTLNRNLSLCLRGSVFQRKVWRCLKTISYGHTLSYSEVAKAIGCPGAARAVGSACARNPWLILVPCHRVVAQKGLGGFALGLSAKKFLLNHEVFLKKKDNINC